MLECHWYSTKRFSQLPSLLWLTSGSSFSRSLMAVTKDWRLVHHRSLVCLDQLCSMEYFPMTKHPFDANERTEGRWEKNRERGNAVRLLSLVLSSFSSMASRPSSSSSLDRFHRFSCALALAQVQQRVESKGTKIKSNAFPFISAQ